MPSLQQELVPPGLSAVHLSFAAPPTVEQDGVSVRALDALADGLEGGGVQRVSIGDNQGSVLDCYTGLGYLAGRATGVRFGPTVANTVTREPAIHAASLASLDAVTSGRAFAVFGTGDGAVRNLGHSPQSVAAFRDSFIELRDLLDHGEAEHEGRRVTMRWPVGLAGRIPLGIAAGGPRMARMAGELADDAYLSFGVDSVNVEAGLAEVTAGATAVGRPAPAAWWVAPFGIAEDTASALRLVGTSLSVLANHSLRGASYAAQRVPDEFRGGLTEFHQRFDWTKKGVAGAEHANIDLMGQTGVLDYLLDRYAVVGTPDEVVARLTALASRGVDRVMLKVNSRTELDLVVTRVLPRVLRDASISADNDT